MTPVPPPPLRPILEAIEQGNYQHAYELLHRAEWDAFQRSWSIAGDLGYARWRLVGGDMSGATAVMRGLVERTGR